MRYESDALVLPQTPFTAEALAKVQEDARHRATRAYRLEAQSAFNKAWGLAR